MEEYAKPRTRRERLSYWKIGLTTMAATQAHLMFCICRTCKVKVNVKSSMARSLPVDNLLPQNVGSIINYLQ